VGAVLSKTGNKAGTRLVFYDLSLGLDIFMVVAYSDEYSDKMVIKGIASVAGRQGLLEKIEKYKFAGGLLSCLWAKEEG